MGNQETLKRYALHTLTLSVSAPHPSLLLTYLSCIPRLLREVLAEIAQGAASGGFLMATFHCAESHMDAVNVKTAGAVFHQRKVSRLPMR